jgi:hypothetical protein
MHRFAPVRRFFVWLLDQWLYFRARLVERRDLLQQHQHEIDYLHDGWRQKEAEFLSQIALKDKEIKSLALMVEAQNARVESLLSVCARVTEDAKYIAPPAR